MTHLPPHNNGMLRLTSGSTGAPAEDAPITVESAEPADPRSAVNGETAGRRLRITERWTAADEEREVKWKVAIHEAGHAVAAMAFGRPAFAVTLMPTLTAEARIHFERQYDERGIWRQLVILAAGGKAVEHFGLAADDDDGGADDRKQMQGLCDQLLGLRHTREERRNVLVDAKVLAQVLIAEHEEQVREIAHLLLEWDRGIEEIEVSSATIDDLVRKWNKRRPEYR